MLKYHNTGSAIHRLGAGTKLLLFMGLILLSISFSTPLPLTILFTLVFALTLLSRVPLKEIFRFAKFIIILSPVVILLQGFHYPVQETMLFELFGYGFYLSGLVFGSAIALRIFIIAFAAPLLLMTTRQKHLLRALGRVLPKSIAFTLTMAFRYIPIFDAELREIRAAQQSRAMKKGNPLPLIVPLFSKALMRARHLAYSAESRAFSTH